MKIKLLILVALFISISSSLLAQKQWSLEECIDYAIENNIQIRQSEIAIKEGGIRLNTAKNSRLPSMSASLGSSLFFGRGPSRDGTYTDNSQTSSSLGVSMNAPIYEGSRIKNEIIVSNLNLDATIQSYKRAKEDLSLNIVSLYMQILFSKELLTVSERQLDLSREFMRKSEILLKNGRASESEYYESVSLMARDKLAVTEANNDLVLRLLDLAQTLNLPETTGFDIINPAIYNFSKTLLNTLINADKIYDIAVQDRPSVKSEEFKLRSFEQQLKVTKSLFLPRISFSAGYNNSYFYSYTNGVNNIIFSEQMKRNGNQTLGLNLSIPIFSKFSNRNQVQLSKLNINSQKLALEDVKRKLQKEIERSYRNADASRQKYLSSYEALKAARIAFKYEEEKIGSGLSTVFDFNDSKTRLIRSESELLRAKYEFLFNKKILDFYAGIPLI